MHMANKSRKNMHFDVTMETTLTATPATWITGFGDSVLDWLKHFTDGNNLDAAQFTVTKNSSKPGKFGKTFTLQRITTISNTPLYNVLEGSYKVSPSADGNSVAKTLTSMLSRLSRSARLQSRRCSLPPTQSSFFLACFYKQYVLSRIQSHN